MTTEQRVRVKYGRRIDSSYWLKTGRMVGEHRGWIMVRLDDGREVGFRGHELDWNIQ